MSGWNDLLAELDAWSAAGHTATFWWRDDDARSGTPELQRLLGLADKHGVPLALSVVPVTADKTLARVLEDQDRATVLQHGYSHQNHAAPGDLKTEFGQTRPYPFTLGDMATGWQRIEALFDGRALAVMVPPWNRIAPAIVPMLPEIGYVGLSTWKPRKRQRPCQGLHQINTHVDIIEWRGSREFLGTDDAISAVLKHLEARREGRVDSGEPTGLLTHHLEHDEDCWMFVDRLLAVTTTHPATAWQNPRDLFAPLRKEAA